MPSNDPSTFTGIYIMYLTQPLVVIARLYHDRPFSTRLSSAWNSVLYFATLLNFAVFFSYVLKWFVLYMPSYVPAVLLPTLNLAKSLP